MSGRREDGYAAIWLAAVMIFLLGAAALAVDASGFFQQARSQQRAADLACLAGAQELPSRPAVAVQKAANYLRPNQIGLAALNPATPTSVAGNVRTWVVGDFRVEIETPAVYSGSASSAVMRVKVSQTEATTFGRAIGSNSAQIVQEAYCGAFTGLADRIIPVGVPGGFGGGIIKFSESQCNDEASTTSGSGVCNYLDIPRRTYDFGGTTTLAYNLILGADWPISASLNPHVRCDSVSGAPNQPCDQVVSKSGNIAGSVYDGLVGGKPTTSHIGRLAYSDMRTTNPLNSHAEPAGGWSAWSKPSSPTSWIRWNTNVLANPALLHQESCTRPASATDYFDQVQFPTDSPADPTSTCEAGEVDDQSTYPVTSFTYIAPPEFLISRFDCRDMRLVVVPVGTWGNLGQGVPANERLFTITGFDLGYLVDPIVEDDDADGDRNGDQNLLDNRLVMWNHQNGSGGVWDSIDYSDTAITQMSMLSVDFTRNGAGQPTVEIVGDCPLEPIDPTMDGLLPKTVRLVPAP